MRCVRRKAFLPFQDLQQATENFEAIVNARVHEDLKTFLQAQMSRSDEAILGVADDALASEIMIQLPQVRVPDGQIPRNNNTASSSI